MKEITSPVEKFSGSVVLSDPPNFPQLIAWQDAVLEAAGKEVPAERAFIYLKGIFEMVEEWKLDNFPEEVTRDNFPVKPVKTVMQLIGWLIGEINIVFADEDVDPNA